MDIPHTDSNVFLFTFNLCICYPDDIHAASCLEKEVVSDYDKNNETLLFHLWHFWNKSAQFLCVWAMRDCSTSFCKLINGQVWMQQCALFSEWILMRAKLLSNIGSVFPTLNGYFLVRLIGVTYVTLLLKEAPVCLWWLAYSWWTAVVWFQYSYVVR